MKLKKKKQIVYYLGSTPGYRKQVTNFLAVWGRALSYYEAGSPPFTNRGMAS